MATTPVERKRRRGLVGLVASVGVSGLGTKMSFLALPWFVLTSTGSATKTGLVAFFEMAPYVTVGGLGGPFVDRLGARRLSVSTDTAAAVFVGLVPVLHAVHLLPLWMLCALVACAGAVRGAGDSSRDVLVPGVSEQAGTALERSSGYVDGANRLSSLAGLPLAGVLVAVVSPLGVLGIDAASFAASALLVGTLVPASANPPRAEAGPEHAAEAELSYLQSLKEGFDYLVHDRLLVGIALMILVTNFVDQAGGAVLFPIWAHRIAHSSVDLGLMGGGFALGAVLGNIVTTWLGPKLPRRLAYAIGFLVCGAPRFFVVAAAPVIAVIVAVSFVSGLGAGGINPSLGAVEYGRVPRRLQARVLGAVGALAWFGIPFGALVGGFTVSAVGLRDALIAGGVVYLVTTLCPFVFPVWAQMNRAPIVDEDEPAEADAEA
ncbi:MAG TPA: MFS transporter, partial [Acidimicrobiales bacterium]|nr:MFS transporter [Acidimicrobiales bacterium]